jgi:hypothetical protein
MKVINNGILDVSNVCPAGSRPYMLRQKPMECRSNKDCMPIFECIKDEKYLTGYCCTRPRPVTRVEPKQTISSNSKCVDGTQPLKTPDGETQLCLPTQTTDCPAEYQCELNTYFGRYQCCPVSNTKAIECSEGMSVQTHPKTNAPIPCTNNADCANFVRNL